jgi:hypothetical protein
MAESWIMLHPIYGLRKSGIESEFQSDLAYKALDSFLELFPDHKGTYLKALRTMGLEIYNSTCKLLGTSHFIDKTPRYYFIIPELQQIFPQASFIILLRNPLAVLSSILNTFVDGNWIRMAKRHYHDLLVAPELLIDGIHLLGGRAITIHYENLVINPTKTIDQLCKMLNLSFSEEMLQYGNFPVPKGRYGDPSGVDQHQHPTTENMNRWLSLGATKQTRHFALHYLQALGPDTISQMGYDFDELQTKIKAPKISNVGLVASWDRIFQPTYSFWTKLSLIMFELLQKRDLIHSAKQFGRLFLGRLSI